MLKKNIGIILAFCMMLGAINVQAAKFTDLDKNAAIIEKLAERGIIDGTSETTFSPKSNVTRAEFSKIVCLALDYEMGEWQNEFNDVSEEDWFLPYVNILAKKGIINGYAGNFYPHNPITNEEAAKVLVALFESETEELKYQGTYATFMMDYYDISPWARDYVNKGVMIGAVRTLEYAKDITNADPALRTSVAKFNPKAYMLREECAEVIYNVTNAIKNSNKYKEVE